MVAELWQRQEKNYKNKKKGEEKDNLACILMQANRDSHLHRKLGSSGAGFLLRRSVKESIVSMECRRRHTCRQLYNTPWCSVLERNLVHGCQQWQLGLQVVFL